MSVVGLTSKARVVTLATLALLAGVPALAQDRVFTDGERQLCASTCEKQLTCAGQAQQRDLVSGCMIACEATLRSANLTTSRPWWAAAGCLNQACGVPYNDCLVRTMNTATIPEQKCTASCGRRTQCVPAGNPAAQFGACQSECVARSLFGSTAERSFEELQYNCSGQACGIAWDVCLAKGQGGVTAECATLCENPFRCGTVAATPTAFQSCMQGCVPAASDPARRKDIEAALRCSASCGLEQLACTSKARGGMPQFCFEACAKQLGCGGAASDVAAMTQCLSSCETVMAQTDPQQKLGFIAVDKCKAKACGAAYNACVVAVFQPVAAPAPVYTPQPVYTPPPPQPVAQPVYTPPPQPVAQPVYTPPAPRPVAQPVYTPPPQPVAQPVYTPPPPRPVAQPVYTPPTPQPVAQPVYTPPAPQPVAQPVYTPPPPQPVAQPVVVPPKPVRDPAREKCEAACERYAACYPGSEGPASVNGGGQCVDNCLTDRSASAAFAVIGRCAPQASCERFAACVLAGSQLTKRMRDCVPSCQKELECAASGAAVSPFDTVTCARSCSKSPAELKASAECKSAACDGYSACMVKAQEILPSKEEVRCRSICDRSAGCGDPPAADGEACVKRCLDDKSARFEFKVREKCAASCSTYGKCMLVGLGVPESRLVCEGACRRDLACGAGVPAAAVPFDALVSCMRSCHRPLDELEAITACAELPCNSTGYQTCIDFKRKAAIAKAAPPPQKDPVMERCTAICTHLEQCAPGAGGKPCIERCQSDKASQAEFKAREGCGSTSCDEYHACVVSRAGVSKAKAACADACHHEINCRPPGEARDFAALLACSKTCNKDKKALDAWATCEARGCGGPFERCLAEKSGQLAAVKGIADQCTQWCETSTKCGAKGNDGCVKRCVESKGQSAEFKARSSCASKACDQYDSCMLDSMGVSSEARRCVESCRWDLKCERGDQSSDFGRLAQCAATCKLSDFELTIRSDCQIMNCGTGFRECVDRRLREAATSPSAPSSPTPPK